MAVSKNVEIKFENNVNKFRGEWGNKKKKILYALGLFFQSTITKVITMQRQVLTGRLRASITFITPDREGKPIYSTPESTKKDYITGRSAENELILGSNLVYAAKVEFSSKKGSYLKNGIMNYRDDAQEVVKKIMEEK